MSGIPTGARAVVRKRDGGQCQRCGGAGTDFHHRQRRRVRWEHQHCSCVGYTLCRTCHNWVHANPEKARENGWITSAWEEEPWTVPVRNFWGWSLMTCDGDVRSTDVTDPAGPGESRSARGTTTSAAEGWR